MLDNPIAERLDSFVEYLHQKGLKFTGQRRLVAEKIFELGDHFTVANLELELQSKHKEISRATIYRIVSVMLEAGLLAEHDFGKSAKYYEQVGEHEHHDHIICTNCGRIEEFCDNDIEKIQLNIAKRLGFTLSNHSLNLYGSCLEFKDNKSCPHYSKTELYNNA